MKKSTKVVKNKNPKVDKSKKSTVEKNKNSRVVKNKSKYRKKYVTETSERYSYLIAILVLSLLINLVAVIHFQTYDHDRPKTVTKIKKEMPKRVVFIGDSITWMYDLRKHYTGKKYKEDYYLVNSGIDGATSEVVLYNIKNRVYQFNPSKVFLMVGTNDIDRNVPREEMYSNIETIIKRIHKHHPKCKVYLESLYPINKSNDERINMEMVGKIRTNKMINEINNEIERIASENDATYINIHDLLLDEDGSLKLEYTREGLHITDEGYDVITKKLKEYM